MPENFHLSSFLPYRLAVLSERVSKRLTVESRVSRAVSKLETDGLVAKAQGQEDARLVSITLTEAGRAALASIIPPAREIEDRLLAAASPDELATFFRVMEKMHKVLDNDPEAKPRSAMDLEGVES